MNFEEIKEFIQLAKAEGVTELEYKAKDKKIAVSFKQDQAIVTTPAFSSAITTNNETGIVPIGAELFHQINSPFVGTFYKSAAPELPPFVKIGDRVSKGQTLCILEAMKIMNEIEADIDGEIVEICADNESLVEFGQVLFKIRA